MSIGTLDSAVVGEVLMNFRKKKGLSQEQVCSDAEVQRTHLSAIEHGKVKPTLDTVYRLTQAMNVRLTAVTREIEKRVKERRKAEEA